MNPERFSGPEEEAEREAAKDKASTAGGAGATAVFGGMNAETSRADGRESPARSLPVVHSVVFKADSSRAEGTDQLMNILRSPGLQPEAPVPAAPPPAAAPASTASAGGFTQLLRALNQEPIKEPAGVEPAKRVDSVATRVQAPPVPVSQVTSFQTQPVSGAQAGSFTQMFQALDMAPAQPATPEQADIAAKMPESGAAGGAPGSFTQMFRALEAAPVAAAREEPQPPPAASGPGSFTQMFAAISAPTVEPLDAPTSQTPVQNSQPLAGSAVGTTPSSFTQMFRALDAAPVESTERAPTPGGAPATFPQMFSTPVAPPPEAAAADRRQAPSEASPGSFTQMFRALDGAPPVGNVESQAHPATGGPGSFTQMFQQVGPSAVEPAKYEADPAGAGPGSFTQMFRSLDGNQLPEPSRTPPERPVSSFPPYEGVASGSARSEPEPSSGASPGSLTQLLRTLDQPAQTPARTYQPPSSPPSAGGPPPPTFTSVYGTLGGETATPAVPPPGMPPSTVSPRAVAPPETGPSDFTRILQASALRENALRGEAAVPGTASGQAPGAASPPPWTMPEAPKMPQAPKAPELKLPNSPQVAAAGLQQYLPLLLIVVIFLLLAILVAVVFLMKR